MKGIKFDNIHSYAEFNLILSEVDIPPATPKTVYVDIPAGDGSVDLTTALGDVRFEDRDCKFTFTVFPQDNFEDKKRTVSNYLNGRRCRIIVDKDPDYYYTGRCTVDEYSSDKNHHRIVVAARVSPYKLRLTPTVVTVTAGTGQTVILHNGRKKVVPTITTTAETEITHDGNVYRFGVGTHKNLNIILTEGDNRLTVTSTGVVDFTYQEGDL